MVWELSARGGKKGNSLPSRSHMAALWPQPNTSHRAANSFDGSLAHISFTTRIFAKKSGSPAHSSIARVLAPRLFAAIEAFSRGDSVISRNSSAPSYSESGRTCPREQRMKHTSFGGANGNAVLAVGLAAHCRKVASHVRTAIGASLTLSSTTTFSSTFSSSPFSSALSALSELSEPTEPTEPKSDRTVVVGVKRRYLNLSPRACRKRRTTVVLPTASALSSTTGVPAAKPIASASAI